jgi:hypothetical protein
VENDGRFIGAFEQELPQDVDDNGHSDEGQYPDYAESPYRLSRAVLAQLVENVCEKTHGDATTTEGKPGKDAGIEGTEAPAKEPTRLTAEMNRRGRVLFVVQKKRKIKGLERAICCSLTARGQGHPRLGINIPVPDPKRTMAIFYIFTALSPNNTYQTTRTGVIGIKRQETTGSCSDCSNDANMYWNPR